MESDSWKSWSGFAFERLSLGHIFQVIKALGINGIYTEESAWRKRGSLEEAGAQIDLLIDRGDHAMNICEIKFSQAVFAIQKKYADELSNKMAIFREDSKTKKTLFLTMITTFGFLVS